MKIEKNAAWKKFELLFGSDDILRRYNWFLFEYGKRVTFLIHQHLLGRISQIQGSKDYKKRLVVAEMRDRSHVWWAIIAKTRKLEEGEHDPKETLLEVIPRYKLYSQDPVQEILVNVGPWTAETIPFVPSARQAAVVATKVDRGTVLRTWRKNRAAILFINGLMDANGIAHQPRREVYAKLQIVPDWELEALRLEYGLTPGGKPHWRPSIKAGAFGGPKVLSSKKDLIRAMTDPTFSGYKKLEHVENRFTEADLRLLERFQSKIKKGI